MSLAHLGIVMGVWALLLIAELAYAQRLTRYRTDVSRGQPFFLGKSWFLHWNPTNPSNYLPAAKPKLRLLYALAVARILATLVLLAAAGRYLFYVLG